MEAASPAELRAHEKVHAALRDLSDDPHKSKRKIVTILWLITCIFALFFVVACWMLALDERVGSEESGGLVLLTLAVIVCSAQGSMVLMSDAHMTSIQYGFMIGHTAIMCNWMLCKLVAPDADVSDVQAGIFEESRAQAVASLGFFLWGFNLATCVALMVWREEIMGATGSAKPTFEGAADETSSECKGSTANPMSSPPSGEML
jgi:hypothetical protein